MSAPSIPPRYGSDSAPASLPSVAPPTVRKPRDPHPDNVRGILIALVVIGHTLEPLDQPTGDAVYRFIYSFHMPAFVALTGYFSRSFVARPRSYVRLVSQIAVPYVIFQLLHAGLAVVVDGDPFSFDLLIPAWTLWFLPAMFFWRALTPLLRKIPGAIGFSVLLSLCAAAVWDDLPGILALNRTIVLLPFFVLGLTVPTERIARLTAATTSLRPRLTATGILVGSMVIFTVATTWFAPHRNTLWNRDALAQLSDDPLAGLAIRLAVLAGGLIGTIAVIVIAPRRKTLLTRLGRYSLYIYLLHSLVLYPLRPITDDVISAEPWAVPALIVGALLLALALSTRPARAVSRIAVEPPIYPGLSAFQGRASASVDDREDPRRKP